jgi:hypothetical protein
MLRNLFFNNILIRCLKRDLIDFEVENVHKRLLNACSKFTIRGKHRNPVCGDIKTIFLKRYLIDFEIKKKLLGESFESQCLAILKLEFKTEFARF